MQPRWDPGDVDGDRVRRHPRALGREQTDSGHRPEQRRGGAVRRDDRLVARLDLADLGIVDASIDLVTIRTDNHHLGG